MCYLSFTQACQIVLVGVQAAALAGIKEEKEERNVRRGWKQIHSTVMGGFTNAWGRLYSVNTIK